jgi:hypothetical protein
MSDLSLRELFEQLVRDPSAAGLPGGAAELLDAHGFGDLDDPLVAEALSNVVDGFPPDVAEHFSAFTVAASPVPSAEAVDIDAATAFDLLASAPEWPAAEPVLLADPTSPEAVDSTDIPDGAEELALADFGAGADSDGGLDDGGDPELDGIDDLDSPANSPVDLHALATDLLDDLAVGPADGPSADDHAPLEVGDEGEPGLDDDLDVDVDS